MDDSAGKLSQQRENQVIIWEFSESESWSVHGDEVAVKPASSSISQNSKAERRKWPHNFYISSEVVSYMDKVYSIVRKTYDRKPTDEMEDFDVNAAIWRMFMKTTLQAAVHLGQDYDQNLRFVKNHFLEFFEEIIQRN